MTLTATWEADFARVKLLWSGTPVATITLWRRSRRYDAEWTFVRSAYGVNGTTGAISIYDYEMPIDGNEVEYAAKSGTAIPTEASPGSDLTTILVQADAPWLRHLGMPIKNTPVIVQSISDMTRPARQSVYEPVNRPDPVVVYDVRGSRRGTVRLLAPSADDSAAIRTAIADGAPLLLQLPNAIEADFPDCYMAIGEASDAKLVEHSKSSAKLWTFPFIEVARPAGDVLPTTARTWADVLAEQPTWDAVRQDTPTWLDVMEGPA